MAESDIPLVEAAERKPYDQRGFRIYDISDESRPRLITHQKTGGIGVHRFHMDAVYAYISTEMAGYVGATLVIYDIGNPAKPEVDIADPMSPQEVGYFIPEPAPGNPTLQTNDGDVDDRGLIYIVDRYAAFDILEYKRSLNPLQDPGPIARTTGIPSGGRGDGRLETAFPTSLKKSAFEPKEERRCTPRPLSSPSRNCLWTFFARERNGAPFDSGKCCSCSFLSTVRRSLPLTITSGTASSM